jgi:hypothetical protein
MSRSQDKTTIGRPFASADLPGFVTKQLDVPPDHTGLIVDGDGRTRTLPPGQHRVVGLWRRLFGRVSDWRFAIIPTSPQALIVSVQHLRTGDGEWVDVTCGVSVRVADPHRFYAQFMRGSGGSTAELTKRLSAGIDAAVRQAVAGWAADDLIRGTVSDRLAAEVRRALPPVADTLGLEIEGVRYVAVRPVDEAVDVARKQAELEAALDEVAMERQMSELATEAEWREFVQNLEADYDMPGLVQEVDTSSDDGEGASESRVEELRNAAQRYADARIAGLSARANRLLGREEPERPEPPGVRWWERIVPWLKFGSIALFIAALALYFFPRANTGREKIAILLELACAVPSAVMIFISALWLERKAARDRTISREGGELLWLGQGDREKIDRLVRDQLTNELRTIARTLRETRDRIYREGHRDQALAVKETEKQSDQLRQAVSAGVRGAAPYLSEAHVTQTDLETMLNYDEGLLAQVNDLSDKTEALRQTVLTGEVVGDQLETIKTGLSELDHRFQARARFIKSAT